MVTVVLVLTVFPLGAGGPGHPAAGTALRQLGKAYQCVFGREKLGFLGHWVSATGVSVDPRKVAAVRDWLAPQSNVELRQFVG
jgi:hypothetical protein